MIINTLQRTLAWFRAAMPKPTSKNFTTQLGCHFEEVVEMLVCLTPETYEARNLKVDAINALHSLAQYLKQNEGCVAINPDDRADYLDAICDQIVTGTGCAHISEFDLVGAMNEVNASNFSKFDRDGNPIFDENMKIMKGPNYRPADLAPFA